MKNYKVLHNENHYDVVEVPTGNVVCTGENSRELKVFANRLNGGLGFNGWTPVHFLNRLTVAGNGV